MNDLRLYFFECGSLKTQVQFIKMNQGLGDPYEIPVPFFLITHPRGNVLYGPRASWATSRALPPYWGAVLEAYEPVMTEDSGKAVSPISCPVPSPTFPTLVAAPVAKLME